MYDGISEFLSKLDKETLEHLKEPVIGSISPLDGMFTIQEDYDHYYRVGLQVAQIVKENSQRDLNNPNVSILDFASGFGRGTRFIKSFFPKAQLFTSELQDPANIFCASTFNSTSFASQVNYSELPVQTTFDAIWVGSLVTHLSEADTEILLDYLRNSLKPDGVLIVSNHGSFVRSRMKNGDFYGLNELDNSFFREFFMKGFAYQNYPGEEGYGISIVSKGWWLRKTKGHGLRLKRYLKKRWDNHQDVVVLHKRYK